MATQTNPVVKKEYGGNGAEVPNADRDACQNSQDSLNVIVAMNPASGIPDEGKSGLIHTSWQIPFRATNSDLDLNSSPREHEMSHRTQQKRSPNVRHIF
jgi:hypothetical protein